VSSNEIFALRKQGRAAEALELARKNHPRNATDIWFLRAYAWTLYDHAKKLIDAYEAKQLAPTALSSQLTPYMREFARIAGPLRRDSTFSQMLRLAGKASKDWREFLGFARWAGISDFAEEDKAAFVNDQGKSVDSLQRRYTRAICREVAAHASDPQWDPELIGWGIDVLEQALQDDPNDQWLNYYQSKLHLARGESDQAIKRLAPVLRRQSTAAWPWALLGEILEAARPDDALTCYAYSAQLAREEQEVAKVRIHLAQRLALVNRFNEAAKQAQLALQYREQHAFKVPQELQQLLASDWYQQAVATNSLRPMPKVDAAARALLQELDRQSIRYIQGVIDHINVEKSLSYVATGASTGFGLPHRKFPLIAELPPGTLVEVGCTAPEGPPIDWRLSEAKALPGLCETLSGSLERSEDKDFAFIRTNREGIFVPPALAKAFTPGQKYDITCLAIRRVNKQGKTGWRAVKVIE
jgi:tetratricopeptide (TPR) repeat protein